MPDNITVSGCSYEWDYGDLELYDATGPVTITIAAE